MKISVDTNPIHNIKEHAPIFIRIIEKNIAFLAGLVDHRLETEERAVKNAKDIFETDKIFDSVRFCIKELY